MILTRALFTFIAVLVLLYLNDHFINDIQWRQSFRNIIIFSAVLYMIAVIGLFEGLPVK